MLGAYVILWVAYRGFKLQKYLNSFFLKKARVLLWKCDSRRNHFQYFDKAVSCQQMLNRFFFFATHTGPLTHLSATFVSPVSCNWLHYMYQHIKKNWGCSMQRLWCNSAYSRKVFLRCLWDEEVWMIVIREIKLVHGKWENYGGNESEVVTLYISFPLLFS